MQEYYNTVLVLSATENVGRSASGPVLGFGVAEQLGWEIRPSRGFGDFR
jgi:hypothetical protein